jgi:DNA-binding HxlR family transcriptional regulator
MSATLACMESATQIQMDPRLPPREQWPRINDNCPMARMLDVLSTRSAFLVLREALYGATRFEQFVERAEVSEPVAAARLRELVTDGFLEKVPYQEPGQRTRHEYHPTEKAADLLPVFVAMVAWGDRWVFDGNARGKISHVDCGEQVGVAMQCAAGHDVASDQLWLRTRRPLTAGTG